MKKTSKAIVLHEANLTGGFGGEIAARIAAPNTPVPFSQTLEDAYCPTRWTSWKKSAY